MRTVTLQIRVQAPDHITDDDVVDLVNQMLDIGQADANETMDDPDIDNGDAEWAASLEVERPEVVSNG